MADLESIKKSIRLIARNPKHVKFTDLEKVLLQLAPLGFDTAMRKSTHGILIRIDGHRLNVCLHHPGRSHVLPVYGKEFLKIMIDLELYDED